MLENNIFSNSFLNSSSNPFGDLAESSFFESFYSRRKLVPLASFPRSINGWIRHLIASFLLASEFKIKMQDIGKNTPCTVEGNAPAITVPARGVYPVDLLVPDIYFIQSGKYEKLSKGNNASLCMNLAEKQAYRLIKTHHIAHSFKAFPFCAALIREPVTCITSASFLLHKEDLDALPPGQMDNIAGQMHNYYLTFMRRCAELSAEMPMIFINVDDPSFGILRLLTKMGIATIADINLMLEIINIYPPQSGFPKKTKFQSAVEKAVVPETNDLYKLLSF